MTRGEADSGPAHTVPCPLHAQAAAGVPTPDIPRVHAASRTSSCLACKYSQLSLHAEFMLVGVHSPLLSHEWRLR